MKKLNFTKMVASGNDFVVVEKEELSAIRYPCLPGRQALSAIAKLICDRKYGVGADGLLMLGKSKLADIKMRIFNADGSEAAMCGNGARCVALYKAQGQFKAARSLPERGKNTRAGVKIETKAGVIASQVNKNNVRIKLTDPKNIKLNIPVKINNRTLHLDFIDTGVPHTVIFVEGLDKINIFNLGRFIRYHKTFAPRGTNVDFVEVLSNDSIKVRTYERGVEDETLACGTGAVASALLYAIRYTCLPVVKKGRQALYAKQVSVRTRGKEVLGVCFDKVGNKFKNVWLEGQAKIVYRGEYYVI